uniref:Uncharacterized protein n=1 Tax=Arundo donax TaxID=35708 RepID=A0A0A9G9L2_ARUDO
MDDRREGMTFLMFAPKYVYVMFHPSLLSTPVQTTISSCWHNCN